MNAVYRDVWQKKYGIEFLYCANEMRDIFMGLKYSDLDEVRDASTRWLYQYNHDRRGLALNRQTPAGDLAAYESTEPITQEPHNPYL